MKEKLVFNKVTKKIARDCTPESLKETIEVTVTEDAVTKTKVYSGIPEGYDRESEDTCTYQSPTVVISKSKDYNHLTFGVVKGSGTLNKYTVYINGNQSGNPGDVKEGDNAVTVTFKNGDTVRVVVSDTSGVTGEDTWKVE